jgi:sigma-B regulation protein RsbU (phosphoserine phosphatase)
MSESRARHAASVLTAAGGAAALFVIGGLIEAWLIAILHPSEGELTWISDLILAISLGIVLYLWLHLRATRAALLELERNEIVLGTQLTVAAHIQRGLLPDVPPPRSSVTWAVQLAAAGLIGGDYYDFVDVGDTSRVAIVADISGKGIPAAMMLVHVRATFRQAVRDTQEPQEIVKRLAESVFIETGGNPYLTCIVVRLDEATGSLTSANAGHPPAVVMGTQSQRLAAGGPPAGLLPGASYVQEVTHLRSGDRVVFVTDGISECLSGDLQSNVARLDSSGTASSLCAAVFGLSSDVTATPPVDGWEDDRTVIVLAVS